MYGQAPFKKNTHCKHMHGPIMHVCRIFFRLNQCVCAHNHNLQKQLTVVGTSSLATLFGAESLIILPCKPKRFALWSSRIPFPKSQMSKSNVTLHNLNNTQDSSAQVSCKTQQNKNMFFPVTTPRHPNQSMVLVAL